MKKICVVNVGSPDYLLGPLTAEKIIKAKLGNVSLISLNDDFAKENARGIGNAHGVTVVGGSDYKLLKGADIVVIAGGEPRKPGMMRLDLIMINQKIFLEVSKKVRKNAPYANVIVVPFGVSDSTALKCIEDTVYGFLGEPTLTVPYDIESSIYEASERALFSVTKAMLTQTG